MFNFRKKTKLEGLEQALKSGLITEEEFLRLSVNRADKRLNDFIKKHRKKEK